jgi:peroxiredoxin Q/BCP
VFSLPLFAQQDAPSASAKPPVAEAPLAEMIGKPAPDFTLPDQNDKPVALKSQKGKWVVLAFYPADMTSGCTFQNRSYTAQIEKFAPLNAVVYTVSTQGTESKREFCTKEGLKHPLLSDVGAKVAKAYGILTESPRFGAIAKRVTFYINPEGKIAAVDSKIRVQQAAEDSLAMLAKLQEKPVDEAGK